MALTRWLMVLMGLVFASIASPLAIAQQIAPGQLISYQPIFPARWTARNPSTLMVPWEGEHVVLLTTDSNLDRQVMTSLVKKLDAQWKTCGELVGQTPPLTKRHNNKVTIATVTDPRMTMNFFGGYGLYGAGGMELTGFYGPEGVYEQARRDPFYSPDYVLFLMGYNHAMPMTRMTLAISGSATLLYHVGSENKKFSADEQDLRENLEQFEEVYVRSQAKFAESFRNFGSNVTRTFNDSHGHPFPQGDFGLFFASSMLKLRKDNGGNEWLKRFYRRLSECPPIVGLDLSEQHVATGQLVNWVVASSLAARSDLTSVFNDRWRLPLPPEIWQALKKIPWSTPDLTTDAVFDSLPMEQLPVNVVANRKNFLTAERRQQNLLVGANFEDTPNDKWKPWSERAQRDVGGSIVSNVAQQGEKSAHLEAPVFDELRFQQAVPVKPHTKYLLGGWIKTQDVVLENTNKKMGANLSIDSGREVSESLLGTNDWRFVSVVFDSGTRTSLFVCARLGHSNSKAKGSAWFDDLVLIPLSSEPSK